MRARPARHPQEPPASPSSRSPLLNLEPPAFPNPRRGGATHSIRAPGRSHPSPSPGQEQSHTSRETLSSAVSPKDRPSFATRPGKACAEPAQPEWNRPRVRAIPAHARRSPRNRMGAWFRPATSFGITSPSTERQPSALRRAVSNQPAWPDAPSTVPDGSTKQHGREAGRDELVVATRSRCVEGQRGLSSTSRGHPNTRRREPSGIPSPAQFPTSLPPSP